MQEIAIGVRVRTARAIAVALAGTASAPRLLDRRELRLFDPDVPDSAQPYHAGLDLPPDDARLIVDRACAAVRKAAASALGDLVKELDQREGRVASLGLVVASLTDPTRITSPHMRAHASEGRLFHDVLVEAAHAGALVAETFLEKDVTEQAAKRLALPVSELTRRLSAFGKELGPPWRKDEKGACLAAWIGLGAERPGA